jgi:Homing endonuclease associated repeat
MRSGPRGDGLYWTPETVLYAIELWVRRYGRVPAARDWDRAGDDHPARQTVQRVFGRWNKAIRQAGYRTCRPGQNRRRDREYPRDERGRFLKVSYESAD